MDGVPISFWMHSLAHDGDERADDGVGADARHVEVGAGQGDEAHGGHAAIVAWPLWIWETGKHINKASSLRFGRHVPLHLG
jgi:hypothetical protein